MKVLLLTVAGCLMFMTTSVSFADCGSACGSGFCDPYDTPCECADPSCGKNPCLSRSDCCFAFGNVGAR